MPTLYSTAAVTVIVGGRQEDRDRRPYPPARRVGLAHDRGCTRRCSGRLAGRLDLARDGGDCRGASDNPPGTGSAATSYSAIHQRRGSSGRTGRDDQAYPDGTDGRVLRAIAPSVSVSDLEIKPLAAPG